MTTQPPYIGLPNAFKQRLLAREKLIGCWSSLASPITAEILGLAGFDWILLDGEHAPNDISTFITQLMALKDSPSAPVVRPSSNDPVQIKRLLDSGFFNVLVPFVETAEQARLAVSACRYPPGGIRGVSNLHRGNRYGTISNYATLADEHICVLIQIESQRGIEAIDEICQVEGIDGIFVGPSDLAADLGHIGDPGHPQVQEVIAYAYERIKISGLPIGTLAPVTTHACSYLSMGASFVAVASDQALLRIAAQEIRSRFS